MTAMEAVAYYMLVNGHPIEEIRAELRNGDVTCSAVEDAIRAALRRMQDEEAANDRLIVRDCGEG